MKPLKQETTSFVGRAAREAAIGRGLVSTKDPADWKAHFEDLGKLCAEAWYDDLKGADRAWAAAHRGKFKHWVRDSQHKGLDPGTNASLQSNHGPFDWEPNPPWTMLL